jgi:hypothetical protein
MNWSDFIFKIHCSAIEQLDGSVLHPQVFAFLTKFVLYQSTVKRIQTDLFKDFTLLNFVDLELWNMKGFIHGNGIEWMRYLAQNSSPFNPNSFLGNICDFYCQSQLNSVVGVRLNVMFTADYLYGYFKKQEQNDGQLADYPTSYFPNFQYTFPDTDFCIFSEFSFNKKILAAVFVEKYRISQVYNCSCSLLWLYRNQALIYNFTQYSQVLQNLLEVNLEEDQVLSCHVNNLNWFSSAFKACNFTDRLKQCNTTTALASLNETEQFYNDAYFQLYDVQNALKVTWKFLSNGIHIAVCVLALSTNLVTATVIIRARCRTERDLQSGQKERRSVKCSI